MAPVKGKDDKSMLQQEDIKQAVIIADSFNVRFAPMTNRVPRVLLPLVNRTMLDYTLELLCVSCVHEVFILCCAHSNQIKEHLKNSRWSSVNSSMTITPIVSESFSLGDVLRELDGNNLIRSDFILISGDVVANLQLLDILEEHKKRKKKDKGSLMTMVFRKAAPKHHSRCLEDDGVVCVQSDTGRILHYQKTGTQKLLKFPLELFQERGEVSLRHDLLDTHISICSPHVLPLFSDNFDYQTRDDFVKGILNNEEILGNSIYCHVAETGYAARVSNLFMYDAISKDIIQRWSYPVVPDLLSKHEHHSYTRKNVYKQKDVDLEMGCHLEKNVVIGQGTKIGTNSFISDSVIGRNCKIGNYVDIRGCYLWDNVTVEDHCKLSTCILANDVIVKSNCVVSPGCVLSYQVIIGPDVTLPKHTLIQDEPIIDDSFDESDRTKEIAYDLVLVGKEGKGVRYVAESGSDSEDEIVVLDGWGEEICSDEDEGSVDEDGTGFSSTDGEMDGESPVPDDTKLFYNEVLDSLLRGVEEKISCENLILEINSSKYAYNVTMKEVNQLVLKAILDIPSHTSKSQLTPQDYSQQLLSLLSQLLPLIRNYIRSKESQLDCLLSLEEHCLCHEIVASSSLMKVLKYLYDSDVLEEHSILSWHAKPTAMFNVNTNDQSLLRKRVQRLIDWLQEAEEESEDSSS